MGSQYIRLEQFSIDADNSNEEDLYVDIKGKGTVVIKSNTDGVSVDIYPMHVVNEPIFTGYVLNSDFDVPEMDLKVPYIEPSNPKSEREVA